MTAAERAGLLGGRVYNSYDFGGYLIARGVPTFIDGRTDQLFLSGFISTLFGAIDSPSDEPFRQLLARYGVTWALVKAGTHEAARFERLPGWGRVYGDGAAVVYRRG